MKQPLFTRSLNRTSVSCLCFIRGIGYCDAALKRLHSQGYVILELPWAEVDIASGTTLISEKGVAITELISESGKRYYVQSPAGDVWAAIHDMPQAALSPEVESIQQAIA